MSLLTVRTRVRTRVRTYVQVYVHRPSTPSGRLLCPMTEPALRHVSRSAQPSVLRARCSRTRTKTRTRTRVLVLLCHIFRGSTRDDAPTPCETQHAYNIVGCIIMVPHSYIDLVGDILVPHLINTYIQHSNIVGGILIPRRRPKRTAPALTFRWGLINTPRAIL